MFLASFLSKSLLTTGQCTKSCERGFRAVSRSVSK